MSNPKKKRCDGCGHMIELYRGAIPCHGPCPIGEKIFVPKPPPDKKLEARLKKMFGPEKLPDDLARKAT